MQFDLSSGTDAGSHALFDPAAVEPLEEGAPHRAWEAWLARQEAAGRLLHYSEASDGELRLKVLVDASFHPPVKHTRAAVVDGPLLRVPSGQLCLAGVEYVYGGDAPNGLKEHMLTRASIPPGTYRVTAFGVNYEMPQERVERELDELLEPGDSRYARRVNSATGVGCFIILAAVVCAVGFVWTGKPWTSNLPAAGAVAAVAAVTAAMLWLLYRSPRMSRWKTADDAMWARYPHVVVELRRLPDEEVPDAFLTGRFGPAYAEASDEND